MTIVVSESEGASYGSESTPLSSLNRYNAGKQLAWRTDDMISLNLLQKFSQLRHYIREKSLKYQNL